MTHPTPAPQSPASPEPEAPPQRLSHIVGLGYAVPAHSAPQQAYADAARDCSATTDRQRRLLDALYQRTTVRQRPSVLLDQGPITSYYPPVNGHAHQGPTTAQRMAAYQRHALGLAEQAARQALGDARVEPDAIDQLVVVTCTGFASPGVDLGLIDRLPLRRDVGRTQLGFMGCHGALSGLRAADALTRATPGCRVLLVCVELCTLHFQYGWEPRGLVANALFADGAAACVLHTPADEKNSTPAYAAAASTVLPGSADDMTWTVGDHGFRMTLAPTVPDTVRRHLGPWLNPWLAEQGLTPSDVAGWAIHPGGPRVLAAVEDALDQPHIADPARDILQHFGNLSSPTVLLILDALRQQQTPRPWVALAFGPGLTFEAALFR